MDEKTEAASQPLLQHRVNVTRAERRLTFRSKIMVLVALALLATTSVYRRFISTPRARVGGEVHEGEGGEAAEEWSWDNFTPSRTLQWQRCYYGIYECARLDVPMDWQDPSDDKRVVLGVVKRPAMKRSLPPVFVNPGGPGGSGINFLLRAGAAVHAIVGENQDLISFDPRGVGVSTPRAECWGNAQKRAIWDMQQTHVVDERPGLEYDLYVRSAAYSSTCESAMNETEILPHLSTASAARDMLEILNQTGYPRLRYWGFSYGTILGGVFAGMFPDRVERLVSDGNVDYESWFNLNHLNFVSDADAILEAWDTACHAAGTETCALWAPTPAEVGARRGAVLESLKRLPLTIPAWSRESGPEMPLVVTYSTLQSLMLLVAYAPLGKSVVLAQVYAGLEVADPLPLYDMALWLLQGRKGGEDGMNMCTLEDMPATAPREIASEPDAFPGIMCSDGLALDDSPAAFAEYIVKLKEVSQWFGVANAFFRSVCIGRTVRPKWRVTQEDFRGDTSHPILFIGNLADNVTPFRSAVKNSARFNGSVVLKQNSYGHCSLAAPSSCTAKLIFEYFQEGTLPAPGTECDADYGLFETPSAADALSQDAFSSASLRLSETVDMAIYAPGQLF